MAYARWDLDPTSVTYANGVGQAIKDLIETSWDTYPNLRYLVLAGVVRTLKVNAEAMAAALDDAMLATDLADYLVRRGVPFRQSHELVGRAVLRAEALGLPLRELPLAELQAISDAFESDLYAVFDHRRSVEVRDSYGGTATAAVRQQIERGRVVLREQDSG